MGGRRRRRILGWLAVLLILGGGAVAWWWLRAPRPLRVVARFSHPEPEFARIGTPVMGSSGVVFSHWMPHVIATTAGLLILDTPDEGTLHDPALSATLRDWDGRVKWQVAISSFPRISQVAKSPDGRRAVVMITQPRSRSKISSLSSKQPQREFVVMGW